MGIIDQPAKRAKVTQKLTEPNLELRDNGDFKGMNKAYTPIPVERALIPVDSGITEITEGEVVVWEDEEGDEASYKKRRPFWKRW